MYIHHFIYYFIVTQTVFKVYEIMGDQWEEHYSSSITKVIRVFT